MNTVQNVFSIKKKKPRSYPHLTPTLLSLLVLLAFALIFWWIHVQHTAAKQQVIAGSNADMYVYHLPVREFGFSELKEGKIPLYNPYTNCGMPFLATYQAGLFYPLNFPHFFLPPAVAVSVIYLMHLFLAGLFMFLWMRELGISELPATFAGAAYMMCSFVSFTLAWPHIILTHTWIPLVFLCIHRVFKRARSLDMLALGAVVGSQFLAGYMQGFAYTLYGAFGYFAFLTLSGLISKPSKTPSLGRAFILTLLGLSVVPAMLTAIQWLPTAELSEVSTRPPGGLSLSAILFGGSLYPSTFLAAMINSGSYEWMQYSLYPGIVALLLAIFALVWRDRWRETAFFIAIGSVAAVIAFGMHTPLFRLYTYLPTGDWFRLPNRLLILTAFCMATLAGFGCNHLINDVIGKSPVQARNQVKLGFFVALSAIFLLVLPRSSAIYVFVLLIGCLLAVRAKWPASAGVLAVVLVSLDLLLYVTNFVTYPWITPRVFPEVPQTEQFLREHVGKDRVHIFRAKHDWKNYLLSSNFGLEKRIRETGGYESLSLQRFAEFCAYMDTGREPSYDIPFTGTIHWSEQSLYPRMLNLLGAKYIVEDAGRNLYPETSPEYEMPNGFNLKKVFSGEMNIYENTGALPRSFFTTKAEVIPDKRAVLRRLSDDSFDYQNVIVLEGQPIQRVMDNGSESKRVPVTIERQGERDVDLVVDAPAAGYIFLNSMYVPGWQAEVDGAQAPLYRADYLFMAVGVQAGKHMIHVQYLPADYRAGKWISVLSLLFFAFLLAYDIARRRAKSMAPWEKSKTVIPPPKRPVRPHAARPATKSARDLPPPARHRTHT